MADIISTSDAILKDAVVVPEKRYVKAMVTLLQFSIVLLEDDGSREADRSMEFSELDNNTDKIPDAVRDWLIEQVT